MKITGRGTTAGWKVLAAGQTSPHLIFREIYNVDFHLDVLLAVLKFLLTSELVSYSQLAVEGLDHPRQTS